MRIRIHAYRSRHSCLHPFTREKPQRITCNFEVHVAFTWVSPVLGLIISRVYEQDLDAPQPIARTGMFDNGTGDIGLQELHKPVDGRDGVVAKALASAHSLNRA
jgi:hypothetical protein